jgi:hypothetical protein
MAMPVHVPPGEPASAPLIVVAAAARAAVPQATPDAQRYPWLVRWLALSISDVVFIATFLVLTFGFVGPHMLDDSGIGWHIRDGERILRTWSAPRVDSFSYTRGGQPWYAWEWLYDAAIALVHRYMGLNGVVLVSGAIVALTFRMLFRWLLARSGHGAVAIALTALAVGSSAVHLLARPHLLTWLFTLLAYRILEDFQSGRRQRLFWLPVMMLLWVNVHGGFLVGLALVGIYLAANLWTWYAASVSSERAGARLRARKLGLCGLGTFLVTFVNPYGHQLYLHVVRYLFDPYLMAHIMEFQSPDFHHLPPRFFELLLMLALVSLAVAGRKLRMLDLLLVLFSMHMAFLAVRNLPIAAIILAPVVARLAPEVLARLRGVPRLARYFGPGEEPGVVQQFETAFAMPGLPVLVLLASLFIGLHSGRVFSRQVLDINFDPHTFPVRATDFLISRGIHDHIFSYDLWGGYLIYRLPDPALFTDDRSDFFGSAFVRQYLKVLEVDRGWQQGLAENRVQWVLLRPNAPLAGALRLVAGWRVVYEDETAVVFARQDPSK